MRAAYSCFHGSQNSSDTVHYGIQYTPIYYEEAAVTHEYAQPRHYEKPKIAKEEIQNSPVKIEEGRATSIGLPPIVWHGYNSTPKFLNIINTGQTILINGNWLAGRPYIEGGPLNGNYVFSQIHFHTPSEHEFEGRRYPLEMHVVHYKSSYLTQERAMNEKDGTVVLVYLFEVLDTNPTAMSSVTKLAPQIEKVNSRTETNEVALEQIVQPFTSNYYIYYGSVASKRNSYLLQWIISGCILCVTSKEADDLLGVMNFDVNSNHLPRMKPEDDILFYVEEVKDDTKSKELLVESLGGDLGKVAESPVEDVSVETLKQQIFDEILQKLQEEISEQINCLFTEVKSSSKYPRSSSCSDEEKKSKFKIFKNSKKCEIENQCKALKQKICSWEKKCRAENVDSSCIESSGKESCEGESKKKRKKKKKKKRKEEESWSCAEVSEDECRSICSSASGETETKSGVESDGNCTKSKKKTKSQGSLEKSSVECISDKEKGKKKSKEEKKEKKERKEKEKMEKKKKKEKEKMEKKEKKEKEKMEKKKEKCQAVCAVATVTDITFDDILNYYNNNWAKENNSPECSPVESTSNGKTVTINDNLLSNSDCSTNIRTLFEKKRDSKIKTLPNEETVMSFTVPDSVNRSYSLSLTQKELDDLKCLLTREKQSMGSKNFKAQKEIPEECLKEFCVQVEVLFRSNNEDFSGCAVQDFNLTLLYNQTVLQEYKGLICPSKLEVGNYETLNLVPTYPETGRIMTRLQNCTVKMETLDKICMRAKFLLSSLTGFEPLKSDKSTEVLKNIILDSVEAETQFSRSEINSLSASKVTVTLDTSVVFEPPVIQGPNESHDTNSKSFVSAFSTITKPNISYTAVMCSQKTFTADCDTECKTESKTECETESKTENKTESKTESETKCKTECNIEVKKESETDLIEYHTDTAQQSIDSCKKEEKTDENSSADPDKELKCIFPNRKKAAFFMCDRIEVDKKSGKRIFVGNFRTKDEVKQIYKDKAKSAKKLERDKGLLLPGKSSVKELFRFQKSTDRDQNSTSLDCSSVNNSNISEIAAQTLSSLNETVNKNAEVHCFIKDRCNMIIGKPVQLEKTSTSFKRLANLIGMDNSKSTNISVYELQNSKDCTSQSTAPENKPTTARTEISVPESLRSIPATTSENLNDPDTDNTDQTPKSDEAQIITDKIVKMNRKSALLIIPIEVESMSKVEVVLIEHKKNFKKSIRSPSSEIIPCLTYKETG